MSLGETGQVEIVTGAASLGQGIETSLAQIGADGLGVAIDDVRVHHGQTNLIAHGMGAFASRVTVMTGSAVHIAAARLKRRVLETAAGLLQVAAEELEIVEGRVRASSSEGGDIALAEVAAAHALSSSLAEKGTEDLSAEGRFETDHMNYPYGLHFAEVCIDRATGGVAVERFIIGYDIGRAINPALIEGQLTGGAAQGIGGALMEAFVYNEAGDPLAASFVDYLNPTVAEMPPVEVHIFEDAPSPINRSASRGPVRAASTRSARPLPARSMMRFNNPARSSSCQSRPSVYARLLRTVQNKQRARFPGLRGGETAPNFTDQSENQRISTVLFALLNRYAVDDPIEGSNPSPSASPERPAYRAISLVRF